MEKISGPSPALAVDRGPVTRADRAPATRAGGTHRHRGPSRHGAPALHDDRRPVAISAIALVVAPRWRPGPSTPRSRPTAHRDYPTHRQPRWTTRTPTAAPPANLDGVALDGAAATEQVFRAPGVWPQGFRLYVRRCEITPRFEV